MRQNQLIIFCVAFFFYGCLQKELCPKDYMLWVKSESNGLRVTKQVDENTFTLQYKPCEYEALMQIRNMHTTKSEFDRKTASMKSMQYFTLCIERSDKKDPAAAQMVDESDYNNRLNYLMFDMQPDFLLVDGTDTLGCAFYHYERNYNLSPENNITLGFELPLNQKKINDKTIIYSDHLLGTGTVELKINASAIQQIPQLKFTY